MAKIIVEGPDGKKYAFPEDMPRAQINEFMRTKYGTKAPTETVNDYLARVVREQDATAARKKAKEAEATAAGRAEGVRAAERMGIDSPLMMAAGANAIGLAQRAGAAPVYEKEGTILPDEAAGLSALNAAGFWVPSMVNQDFGARLDKARKQNPQAALVGDLAGGFLPGEIIGGVVSKAAQSIGPGMERLGQMFKSGGQVETPAPLTLGPEARIRPLNRPDANPGDDVAIAAALDQWTPPAQQQMMPQGFFGGGKKPPPPAPEPAPTRQRLNDRYESLRTLVQRQNPGADDAQIDALTADQYRAIYKRPPPGVQPTARDFEQAWTRAVQEAKSSFDETLGPGNYTAADLESEALAGFKQVYPGGTPPEDTMALPLMMARDGERTVGGGRTYVFEVNGKAFTGATPEEASRRAGDLSPALGDQDNLPNVRKYAIEADGTEIPYEEAIRTRPKAPAANPVNEFARLVAAEKRLNTPARELSEGDLFRLAEPYAKAAAEKGESASDIERAALAVYRLFGGDIKAQGPRGSLLTQRGKDTLEETFGAAVMSGQGSVAGMTNDLNGDGTIDEKDAAMGSALGLGLFLAPGVVRGAAEIGKRFKDGVKPQGIGKPRTPQQAAKFETPGSPEYEAAIAKGLDMSTPARMARAKEMGFDTETVLYHGTASDVDVFKVGGGQGSQSNEGALGVWLTPDPKIAETFSDFAIPRKADGSLNTDAQGRYLSGSNILPVYGRLKNPKVYEAAGGKDPYLLMQLERQKHVQYVSGASSERTAEGKLKWAEENTQAATAAFRKELQDQGYDGIIIRRTEYDAVGAPTDQVVIFDPSNIRSVNAAFDPDKAASPILTAGMSGKVKPQGFYHGTGARIEGPLRPSKDGLYGPGIYLTPDKTRASGYAGPDGQIIEADIAGELASYSDWKDAVRQAAKGKKPGDQSQKAIYKEAISALEAKGFVGVKSADTVTVWRPENLTPPNPSTGKPYLSKNPKPLNKQKILADRQANKSIQQIAHINRRTQSEVRGFLLSEAKRLEKAGEPVPEWLLKRERKPGKVKKD